MADRLLTDPPALAHLSAHGRHADALAYLRLLAGRHPERRFFEIRAISNERVQRSFVAAERPRLATVRIRELAQRRDVYLGVALRTTNQFGGKQAIDGSHLAWIECDDANATDTLRQFEHPPTMVIASGTPGHLHIYWQLRHTYANEQIERANRQLAHHLGGDPASVDIARLLRPPASLNHKHTPPTPVELVAQRPGVRYTLTELTAGLADPQPANTRQAAAGRAWVSDVLDARLRAIPTADYVRALTGRLADRAGKISCPFHEDDTPSLQLYAGGTFYCFGCQFGGSIYDFAAALWLPGRPGCRRLRGDEFTGIRQRLAALLEELAQGS
jgi:hypothetical protein